jgi:DNA replication protein DnaC
VQLLAGLPFESRRRAREEARLQRRLSHVDLLVLDELGFVPFDRAGGELLFNLLTERYERRSVIVTTNLAFGEWVKVFGGDKKLTTALLAHHATVIPTKGKSYRMRKRGNAEEKNVETADAALPKAGRKA